MSGVTRQPAGAWWACLLLTAVLSSTFVHSQGTASTTLRGVTTRAAGAVGLGPKLAPTLAPKLAPTLAPGPAAASPLVGGGTYVALGDSYSAGVGAGTLSNGDCEQSFDNAWPTLLAKQLGLSTSDYTLEACSGYTSTDILYKESGYLSEATTLITLTAGGDDIGVASTLEACLAPNEPTGNGCSEAVAQSQQNISKVSGSLDALFQRIRLLSPKARVFVATYPNLVPDTDCQLTSFLSTSDLSGLKSLVNPLDQQIADAVTRAGAGFYFVDVRPAFAGHMVCSPTEWVNGVVAIHPSESYHPNAAGQAAYQKAVLQALSALGAPAPASSA